MPHGSDLYRHSPLVERCVNECYDVELPASTHFAHVTDAYQPRRTDACLERDPQASYAEFVLTGLAGRRIGRPGLGEATPIAKNWRPGRGATPNNIDRESGRGASRRVSGLLGDASREKPRHTGDREGRHAGVVLAKTGTIC
jgi:hypothetical protein